MSNLNFLIILHIHGLNFTLYTFTFYIMFIHFIFLWNLLTDPLAVNYRPLSQTRWQHYGNTIIGNEATSGYISGIYS